MCDAINFQRPRKSINRRRANPEVGIEMIVKVKTLSLTIFLKTNSLLLRKSCCQVRKFLLSGIVKKFPFFSFSLWLLGCSPAHVGTSFKQNERSWWGNCFEHNQKTINLCYRIQNWMFVWLFVCQSWPFHTPVSAKNVPDYTKIVKNPIDLQTLREVLKLL